MGIGNHSGETWGVFEGSELFELGKIIASESAPVERRGFYDLEGKWISYNVRLGNAWSEQECIKRLHRLFHHIVEKIPEQHRQEIKTRGIGRDHHRRADLLIVMSLVTVDIDKIRQYAPAILSKIQS
jgi:hypothetical protein